MTSPAVVQPWRSSLFLFAVVCTANAGRSHRRDVSTLDSLHLYPRPAYLPIMPYYEVDIPEQEGKFFGVMAATRYETIIVRETVRPVCLYVDGNVPSCDHVIHSNHNGRPQKVPGPVISRRPPAVDYETYFIEPSKPDAKIE
ncbi:unnamed protein product [Macrosiphum euphorbiae]|uniref:Secreted protein n=1 Tax=Macrosiphum euphorbiae TaxID=13131 RepID=A0AAV0VZR9_9HEMI|nr:unnamed protein product [Macrosiphum euphorbiae]